MDWVAGLERVSEGSASVTLTRWRAQATDAHLAHLDLPGLFGPPQRAAFSHGQRRTADSLLATIATHSRLLVMDDPERTQLLSQIRDYLMGRRETAAGEFTLPMITAVLRARRL